MSFEPELFELSGTAGLFQGANIHKLPEISLVLERPSVLQVSEVSAMPPYVGTFTV